MVAGVPQVVEFVELRPHVRKDGRETQLTVLRRKCRDCDRPFEFTQALSGRMGVDVARMVARCEPCRAARKPPCPHLGAQRHPDGSLTCLVCRAPVALRGGADEPWRFVPTPQSDSPAPARAEPEIVSC